jgi:hypothetical protein
VSQTTTAVPKPEAEALEALHDRTLAAQQAFAAVQKRVAEGGKLQRLAPGVWLVTHDVPEPEGEA